MWNRYYDANEDKTYEFNLTVLPYITVPKETLKQMRDILEHEKIGKIYEAVCDYIYENKEVEFETKAEQSFFNTLIEQITRLSAPYFKKLSKLKNQSGAVRIINNTQFGI